MEHEEKKIEENFEVEKVVEVEPAVAPVMTTKDWLWTLILISLPIVNVIAVIVWLTSDTTNKNKKNFALASIILMVIGFILSIIFSAVLMNFVQNQMTYNLESYQEFEQIDFDNMQEFESSTNTTLEMDYDNIRVIGE
ncbi:hypothetical protein CL684_02560 [Candidatus Campbellbacteria bacterium]|nr:hypothetical protein [Candidatus Campbellbacteria bacterium]|tara:strand:+ start:2573 stop:2986 length:414 start_codon:yes stop_codon:yes gene_type:complete